MIIWQADFYKHLSQTNENNTTWNLIICDQNSSIIHEASCQQSEANSNWLIAELTFIFTMLLTRIESFVGLILTILSFAIAVRF